MIDNRNSAAGEAGIGLPSKKSMIYVVDDDYDVRTSLRFLLETEGFDVRTFRSGVALLGSSTRNRADCLVVDYKMAELDGLELAYRLRRLDVSTPTSLTTGNPAEITPAKPTPPAWPQGPRNPNSRTNWAICVHT